MKKKIVVIKQQGIKDCGVSSLLSIIKYYNGNVPIEKLRELTKTNKNGTTAYHLKECANSIGFCSNGVKCNDIKDLKNVSIPFIAHLVINKSYKHYVVVYKINYKKKIITLMDPNYGIKKISFDEFNNDWSKVIITFIPIRKIIHIKENNLSKLIKIIITHNKKTIINIVILSIFITIFNIINSYYFKFILDNYTNSSINNFYIISLSIFIIIVFKIISDYYRHKSLMYLNSKIDYSLITNIFKHVIHLPYDYFKNRTTGEIVSRINDLNYIKDMISKISLTLFVDTGLVIITSFILYSINSTLFLISFIIFLLYFLIIIIFSNVFKNKILENQKTQANANSYLIESINSFESTKGLCLESNIYDNFEERYINYLNSSFSINNISNIQMLFKDFVGGIGLFIIIFFGYLFVLDNKMTIGDLIAFNALLTYFLEPIKNVIDLEPLIRYSKSSFNRIKELYNIEKENLLIDEKFTNNDIMGKLKIQNLNYSINDKDLILKNINLNINIGEKVMIIGKSGCGKSTLLRTIMKYMKIDREKIIIDDKDLNDYNTYELRKNISYISQNETLFTDSIYNNITIKNNCDYDCFLNVVKITEVDKIIKNKYLGYDTLLEEDGFNISGGERARIILSRALLNNSNIFLFDEALNELDVNMERRILKKLFNNYQNKTMIIVSHRLENIDLFDKVIKMENGCIINTGTKREIVC